MTRGTRSKGEVRIDEEQGVSATASTCSHTSGSRSAINSTCATVVALRSRSQRDHREMLATSEVLDLQFESNTWSTPQLGRRSGARCPARPSQSGLEAWLHAGRRRAEVDLVRRPTVEAVVRTLAVVPLREDRQVLSQRSFLIGNEQPSSALLLDGPDQTLDERDGTVLSKGTEALLDTASSRPVAEGVSPDCSP
jgi:hypothetical protein